MYVCMKSLKCGIIRAEGITAMTDTEYKLYKPAGDVVRSLLTIGNAHLFSPTFLQSCSLIHESGSDNPFQRFEIFHDGGRLPLRFGPTGNRSIRSAIPENPTLKSNVKSIGSVAEIRPSEILI